LRVVVRHGDSSEVIGERCGEECGKAPGGLLLSTNGNEGVS